MFKIQYQYLSVKKVVQFGVVIANRYFCERETNRNGNRYQINIIDHTQENL